MSPRPRSSAPGALLLTPGAGADRDHHTLVAVADAVAPLPVARIDFPYRREGRRAPDRAPKAIACIREEAAALVSEAGIAPDRLVLGGRSYGGRMCSLAVAEGLPAAGLVLLSYPLHPPGKPDQLRTEHFGSLELPCLFVSGDRDPFGSPEEFADAIAEIPGPVTQVWVSGGHDPRKQDEAIADAVRTWLASL
ncbi:alpha/beta hydrolase family protein [Rhabdothermincola sediminis]|uniref:alpha/beta hydrolase family protein n=1 Tax=Rhabdothermincola sediminis TaxID=2751370 RepID=UPI001AA01A75|nr:alpha/beta family hydrolase [Rhabdothermincola sediminis]